MAGTIILLMACAIVQTPQGSSPAGLPLPKAMDAAPLRESLYNRNRPQEQSQAALLLVQSESAEVAALVGFELTRWDRPDVFQALATAIRLRRDTRFMPAMLEALGADQTIIRQAAMETLAWLPPAAVHDQLLRLASHNEMSALKRQTAVEALGKVATKQCIGSLLQLVGSPSNAVKQAATLALQEISGQEFGSDAPAWAKWWNLYESMPEAEWQASRQRFFEGRARRLRDELNQAETTLLQLHKELLDKVLQPDLVSYLTALAANNYPAVRELAVTKIGEQLARKELDRTARKLLTESLLQLSRDGSVAVQQRAVIAMEKADLPEVYPRLIDLLRDRSVKVRAAAARSLGNYRGVIPLPDSQERTLKALELALQDSSPAVVASAATSIGALQQLRSPEILARLLKHPSDEVRVASSAALESVASCQVYWAVLQALEDTLPEVRLYLVGCLARMGEFAGLPDREQGELLTKLETVLAQDGDPGVRSKAAASLGKVGSAKEIGILWQRVQANEDGRVQDNAWKAMIEILDRTESWPLVVQWERFLTSQGHGARRLQLLAEMRDRWSKKEATRPVMDQVHLALIDAALAQRKWAQAVPVSLELIRNAAQEQTREERLRLLLIACQQAVQEGKGTEVLPAMKEVEGMLTGFQELGAAFDELRRRTGGSGSPK